MEVIFEIVLLVVFKIPGSFFRWLFTGCKKPLRHYINNGDAYLDGIIGLSIVALIVLIIKKVF